MKKIWIFSLIAVAFAMTGASCTNNQTDSGNAAATTNDAEEAVELGQKSLDELQGQETDLVFDDAIALNEEAGVTFRMRDYANAPKEYDSLSEMEAALIDMEGTVTFKPTESGSLDAIGNDTAPDGQTFYYVLYEFKGDPSNPDSNTIHPSMSHETGWDPAPQFVMVMDGDTDYPGSYYENDLLETKNIEETDEEFTDSEWSTQAAVWEAEVGADASFGILYTAPDGIEHLIPLSN